MERFRASAVLAFVVVAPFAAPLLAAPPSPKVRQADALFQEGMALVDSANFDAACPKFAESYDLDPAPGTLANAAQCWEKTRKLTRARDAYRSLATIAHAAGRKDKEEDARARIAALETRLCQLTLIWPPGVLLHVSLDGAPVAPGSAPIEVDPGGHKVEADGPTVSGWSHDIGPLKDGEHVSLELPASVPTPPPASPAPAAPPPPPTPPALASAPPDAGPHAQQPPKPEAPPPAAGWMRPTGIGLGVAGIAGLAVGALFGLEAISKKGDANCPNNVCSDPRSKPQGIRDAEAAGTLSTLFFAAGGVLGAAGITLLVLAPKRPEPPAAALLWTGSGLGLRGRF